MTRHVVVIGGGAAGTAAALAASAAGARVTIALGRTGSTSLGCGALDGEPDDDASRAAEALGIYTMGTCTLATSAGTLRASTGRDRALADVAAKPGAVLVARVPHPAWDADALAASFAEQDPSRSFVARDIGLVLHTPERSMQHAELAALHDDDERLATAATRIRTALEEGGAFDSVLLPPWLGVASPRAEALSKLVGIACGEVLCAFDGPAGSRFERARDRALGHPSITIASERVRSVATSADDIIVTFTESKLDADAVVLATGGVLAGGIVYTPGDAAHAFALSYDAPVTLGLDGRALLVPGSIFGVAPESVVTPRASSPLERVGILRAPSRIFVAGDAMCDRARTMLAAFSSGTAAGRAAAKLS